MFSLVLLDVFSIATVAALLITGSQVAYFSVGAVGGFGTRSTPYGR